jgi:hypothetical protein
MIENLEFPTKNRSGSQRKTHCIRGHELTEENTYQTLRNGKKNGRKCRICSRGLNKIYRENYPEAMYKCRTNSQMRGRYGISSLQECDELLESQNGKCAICGTSDCHWGKGFKDVWHIDHKHNGEPNHRGILCASCNHTLGRLEDDPIFIQKFIDYLKKYQ